MELVTSPASAAAASASAAAVLAEAAAASGSAPEIPREVLSNAPSASVNNPRVWIHASAMTAQFLSLINSLGVPKEAAEFLSSQGIIDCADFAVLCASEMTLNQDIINMFRANNVGLRTIREEVSVKKLWMSCRKYMSTPGSAPSGPEGECLPKETELDLKKRWFSVHGFVIPDNWLLTAQLQKKLWTAASCNPPVLEAFLMESLRLSSQRSRASGTSFNVVAGQAMSATTVELDVLPNSIEVYTRARAWFITLAFVSIGNSSWFDLQTALFASEKILELVQYTSGGHAPPLSHFISAWAATINHFSEQVRISGDPVITFVKNTGSWEHKWSWSAPASYAPAASDHHPKPAVTHSDLSKDVAMDVAQMQAQARYWQAIADRGRNEQAAKAKGKGYPFVQGQGQGKYKGGKGKPQATLTPRAKHWKK